MSGLLGIRTLDTFGASGILSGLNDTDRQTFINYCPELKMFFPSLHSPHCFGADPDPLGCFRCVNPPPPPYLYLSLPPLSLSLSFSLSLSLSFCVSLCVSLCLSLCLSVCLPLSVCVSLSVSLPVSLSMYLYLHLYSFVYLRQPYALTQISSFPLYLPIFN